MKAIGISIIVEEVEVHKQTEERKKLEKDVGKFVQAVVDNLKARFPHSQLIQEAKVFDPKAIPKLDDDCEAYGEDDILLLARQYSSFVNHSQCLLEWDTLKHCIKLNYSQLSFWDFVLKLANDETLITHYPSISKFAEIIILYPASTSEVERGFSYQNAIKTKFRNRLGAFHLDQLLRLRLNALKASNFLFHDVYKSWVDAKHRRYVIPQPENHSDNSDSSDSE